MSKHSQLLRSVADLLRDSHYDHNRESVSDFVARGKLTPEQTTWAAQQRLVGPPSFSRLRGALRLAGLLDVTVTPDASRECFEFSFRPDREVTATTADELMRLMIGACRSAGFDIGFEDLGFLEAFEGKIVGRSRTVSVNYGPPAPSQLPDDCP